MSPKVAQIVETTVLTYNDPFLRSLKCHHSFWATFVSKFVRLNFQNMPNLVTLSLFHPHLSLSVSLPLTHLYTSLFRVGSISLSLSLSLSLTKTVGHSKTRILVEFVRSAKNDTFKRQLLKQLFCSDSDFDRICVEVSSRECLRHPFRVLLNVNSKPKRLLEFDSYTYLAK